MGRETITYETGGQSEKDVMVKDPERPLSKTQHLATRNLMDPNEIRRLAPDTLLLMRPGENPLIVKNCVTTPTRNSRGCLMWSKTIIDHRPNRRR